MSWILLAAACLATAAQPGQPDFSGRWTLVSTSGQQEAALELTIAQTVKTTNVYGAPMTPFYDAVRVEQRFKAEVRTFTRRIGIIGGIVGGVAGPTGSIERVPRSTFSTTWRGSALVFRSGTYPPDRADTQPISEHEERWEYDAAGRLVIASTDRSATAPAATSTAIYARAGKQEALVRLH